MASLWFAFWMILAAESAADGNRDKQRRDLFGFFNGAWWALPSFAWPWIMPTAIDRWMYRSEGLERSSSADIRFSTAR